MSQKRLETKVGLFVLLGLVLLGVLMVLFSKGFTFNWDIYHINLQASNVGGLKLRAGALMSGVQIGSVSGIKLAPDGKSVLISIKLSKDIVIHRDARFVIEQAGFLGDQYVSIIPTANLGEVLTNNAVVPCEEPFNMLQVARDASGFIVRIDDAAKKLDAAIADLRKYVLNEQTLSNFSGAVGNVRQVSEHALVAVDRLSGFVETNSAPMTVAVSNLVYFSEQMSRFSGSLNEIAATNREDISSAIKNIKASSETLKSILSDLQAGKGPAGKLLKDEQLAANISQVVTNLSLTTSNLAVTTSNVNSRGLWGVLWKPKPPKTNVTTKPVYPGRNPFN